MPTEACPGYGREVKQFLVEITIRQHLGGYTAAVLAAAVKKTRQGWMASTDPAGKRRWQQHLCGCGQQIRLATVDQRVIKVVDVAKKSDHS